MPYQSLPLEIKSEVLRLVLPTSRNDPREWQASVPASEIEPYWFEFREYFSSEEDSEEDAPEDRSSSSITDEPDDISAEVSESANSSDSSSASDSTQGEIENRLDHEDTPPIYMSELFLNLRLVCAEWNGILVHDPKYWNELRFDADTRLSFTVLVITRSGNQPLAIDFVADPYELDDVAWLEPACRFLGPYLSRCVIVELRMAPSSVRHALSVWTDTSAPLLQCLMLGVLPEYLDSEAMVDRPEAATFPQEFNLFNGHMPRLTRIVSAGLSLENFPYRSLPHSLMKLEQEFYEYEPYQQIIKEMISSQKALEEISLTWPGGSVELSSVFSLTELRHLELYGMQFVLGERESWPLSFSKLTDLCLESVIKLEGTPDLFLDLFEELPALEKLKLGALGWEMNPGGFEGGPYQIEWRKRGSLQRLRTISCSVDNINPRFIFALLHSFEMPSLFELNLDDGLARPFERIPGRLLFTLIGDHLKDLTFPELKFLFIEFLEDDLISAFLHASPKLEVLSGADIGAPGRRFFNDLLSYVDFDIERHVLCPNLTEIAFMFRDAKDIRFREHEDHSEAVKFFKENISQIVEDREQCAQLGICKRLRYSEAS
ncbi:hypothetical protein SISSUDRAFT_1044613 [Sistotremastrum suecicum HHB10207 ss-3]|uniref:F-box domain-containing protein n=1 Tax=Sistotremastrum suecicum HHB10207 ss-3 TaxID=1314776 RepID=A0A166F1G9_9AGAM|nr:hypothetical protein SISSUDRAFT_1044613 [Sistotremastrum suecicum HHB10207 ss-3]